MFSVFQKLLDLIELNPQQSKRPPPYMCLKPTEVPYLGYCVFRATGIKVVNHFF